mgnify:FL=1
MSGRSNLFSQKTRKPFQHSGEPQKQQITTTKIIPALNEDDSRIRKDNAPQNFAVLRHIAVNLLGKEKSKKLGTKNKQFLAAMDDNYLAKILELSC